MENNRIKTNVWVESSGPSFQICHWLIREPFPWPAGFPWPANRSQKLFASRDDIFAWLNEVGLPLDISERSDEDHGLYELTVKQFEVLHQSTQI